MTFELYQQRVVDELQELNEKLTKLDTFIYTSPIFAELHPFERARLMWQQRVMSEYVQVLEARIKAFSSPEGPKPIPRDCTAQPLIAEFLALMERGLRQGEVMHTLGSRYSQTEMASIIEYARDTYTLDSDDDIEIDESPIFSETDNGTWVSAWVWVPKDDDEDLTEGAPSEQPEE